MHSSPPLTKRCLVRILFGEPFISRKTTEFSVNCDAIAGSAAGRLGMGAGIGAAAGALGGLASVLSTRGPDATLERGSTVEMILDRQLTFTPDELRSH